MFKSNSLITLVVMIVLACVVVANVAAAPAKPRPGDDQAYTTGTTQHPSHPAATQPGRQQVGQTTQSRRPGAHSTYTYAGNPSTTGRAYEVSNGTGGDGHGNQGGHPGNGNGNQGGHPGNGNGNQGWHPGDGHGNQGGHPGDGHGDQGWHPGDGHGNEGWHPGDGHGNEGWHPGYPHDNGYRPQPSYGVSVEWVPSPTYIYANPATPPVVYQTEPVYTQQYAQPYTEQYAQQYAAPSVSQYAAPDARQIPLLGCELRAADGTFLGNISRDYNDPKCVINRNGPYGSPWSRFSIYNAQSPYGDPQSALSAWNPYTTTPPALYFQGQFKCYITMNPQMCPHIIPGSLLDRLVPQSR